MNRTRAGSVRRAAVVSAAAAGLHNVPPRVFEEHVAKHLSGVNAARLRTASKGSRDVVGNALAHPRYDVDKLRGRLAAKLKQVLRAVTTIPDDKDRADALKRQGWTSPGWGVGVLLELEVPCSPRGDMATVGVRLKPLDYIDHDDARRAVHSITIFGRGDTREAAAYSLDVFYGPFRRLRVRDDSWIRDTRLAPRWIVSGLGDFGAHRDVLFPALKAAVAGVGVQDELLG